MNKVLKASAFIIAVLVLGFYSQNTVLAYSSPQVQTSSATNVQSTAAVLNGNISDLGGYGSANVWFQWGTSTSYGNNTPVQTLNFAGSFSQNIVNLSFNTTYHFRAAVQNNNGTFYGQDMVFNSSGSNYYGNATLTVNKQVINLTTGNLRWSNSVSAKPFDVLSFAITIQANNQEVRNVVVRDVLPGNLIYRGNLTVNASLSQTGNLSSGINIGTIPAGNVAVIAYQAQVASAGNFSYGTAILNNNVTVTSDSGTQTANVAVVVNNSNVAGITDISTGLTNNFFADSFLLPILIILGGAYLYYSGRIFRFADWLKRKI